MDGIDKNIRSVSEEFLFDFIIRSKPQPNQTGLTNLGDLLFNPIGHRNENAIILASHQEEEYLEINLNQLRAIVGSLYLAFEKHGIKRDSTVLLSNLEVNSELYISILFLALASYGVRVFMPMYLESAALNIWNELLEIDAFIIPGKEIYNLKYHERQKQNIDRLKTFSGTMGICCLDIFDDLSLNKLINNYSAIPNPGVEIDEKFFRSVSSSDTALLITTSGTSGESKIVSYDHSSFLINISAWKNAGLFDSEKLGGRGFTPLFTHTMGIRTFLNSLWLGEPVIIINTEWFTKKPETVSYFLKRAKPEHVTAGPAVFNMLLEMSRTFPDLKKSLRKSLKTIVSSGAPFNEDTVKMMQQAFDCKYYNAFGSTETQQVLTSAHKEINSQEDYTSLGRNLPGVTIGLQCHNNSNAYKLFIKSEFGGNEIIESGASKKIKDKYIYLGDLVEFSNDKIKYLKREKEDFINDEFGMKVPLNKIRINYKKLFEEVHHVKIFPLRFKPGLGVIIFIRKLDTYKQDEIHTEIHAMIETTNQELYQTLDPLQFNHWTIQRFSIIDADKFSNWKGIISGYKVDLELGELILRLTSDNKPRADIFNVRSIVTKPSDYAKYHNPYIGKLLACLEMDVAYDIGEGDYLITGNGRGVTKILDLTGGYGTNLLGHHNKELTNCAIDFLKFGRIPLSDQLSLQQNIGELSKKLNELIGHETGKSYYTLFGSTGSEVVEIAIHHAYLEWKRRIRKIYERQVSEFAFLDQGSFEKVWNANWRKIKKCSPSIIANHTAFHGTTTSARAVMGDNERREKFRGLFNITALFVDDNDPGLLETIKRRIEESSLQLQIFSNADGKLKIEDYKHPKVIAAIVEPIIGEGGIRKINPEFPKILSSYSFPLIVDEIQCGLGRSGSFLASSSAGYRGHYYLFSKALGGNLAKIAAIAIEKERFIKKIGKLYVSTFSNGAFAARVATENLRIIERENIPKRAYVKGNEITSALQIIADKYPEVIDSIQGEGLMIGIRFSQIAISRNLFLRVLYNKKNLGYLLSSYMLNIHQVRILPSLSAPDVLRVEPSVNISKNDIEKLYNGILDLASLIDAGHFYQLVKHLMKGDPFVDNKGLIPAYGSMHQSIDAPREGSVKAAFLAHFVYPTEEFRMLSDDLQNASDTGLRHLYNKFETMMEMDPFLLNARNVFNDQIHLSMYLIPLDSSALEKLHRTEKYTTVIRKIQKAVQMAAKSGNKVISLGGYTSIISNNGKAIVEPDEVKVVTGNTLTAVIGYHNFKRNVQQKLAVEDLDIGIIGASGNIGSILSKKLVNDPSIHPRKLFLFGRNTKKLEWLRQQISELNAYKETIIVIRSDLMDLKNCNAIINVANTNDPIIFANQITKSRPVIISDISIPAGISDEIQLCPNVEVIPFIASVNLPQDSDFLMTSCSPRGTALCCAAEAILVGFEDIPIDLRGDITLEGFDMIYKLANKYGFIENTKMIRGFKSVISNEVSI